MLRSANMRNTNLQMRLKRKWKSSGRNFCGAILRNASVCVAPDLPLQVIFRYWHTRLRAWIIQAQEQNRGVAPLPTAVKVKNLVSTSSGRV
jgi:hypothetical protein